PPSLLAPVMALGSVGCVLAIPLVIGPLLTFVGRLLRTSLGLEGGLAVRQLQRQRTRTNLTVGILSIAIFITIGLGNGIQANVEDIRSWTRKVVAADYFVRGAQPDAAYAITAASLPESVGEELASLPGVEHVDKLSWILARAQGRHVVVLAYSFAPNPPLSLDLVQGEEQAVLSGLMRGETVLGTALASK